MAAKVWSIGYVSEQSGVNIETVRYYERIGLMPAPPRSAGGHRVYDENHLKHLQFIMRGRELGFSINQIKTLLTMAGGGFDCGEIHDLTVRHLEDINGKIRDLQKLSKTLREVASKCELNITPDCPIIDALFAGVATR